MVSLVVQVDMYDGVAFWFYWFCDQGHSGLFGCSAAFFYVAFCACADDIFPCGWSSEGSWDDVVEGQLGGWVFFSAILAMAAVTCVDVSPVKLYGFSREAVVKEQADNSRDGDVKVYG